MIKVVRREMLKHTDQVKVDRIGNVIGTLRSEDPNAQTLMILAHMDEIGFVVRHITPNGFIRVYRVGYPLDRVLPGTPIALHSENGTPHHGVFGVKSHHYTPPEEKWVVHPIEELYVDAGFTSADAVKNAGIQVGSPITFWPNFRIENNTIISKTLDNRLCLYAMLQMMENLAGKKLPVNVACVGTVQEEFSIKGSVVAGQQVKPDMAVALDVTIAMDTPDLEDKELGEMRLGEGIAINRFGYHPTLPFYGTTTNPKLFNQMLVTAQNHAIPHTRSVSSRIMTDASELQYINEGVPVIELGIPTRYTHSPSEMSTVSDTQSLIKLLTQFALELPAPLDLSRG